jgi:hypothetical protein
MATRERDILEQAVRTIAEQAVKADELVDEAKAAGGGDHPVTVHAKMLRLELLKVKADLERDLETRSLNCTKCGLDVHWVSGLGVTPGHWAHREPAPHGEPAVWLLSGRLPRAEARRSTGPPGTQELGRMALRNPDARPQPHA